MGVEDRADPRDMAHGDLVAEVERLRAVGGAARKVAFPERRVHTNPDTVFAPHSTGLSINDGPTLDAIVHLQATLLEAGISNPRDERRRDREMLEEIEAHIRDQHEVSVNDDIYRRLCKHLGRDPLAYLDREDP